MASFEERFAAVGRAIDGLFERIRRGRAPRHYRSRRSGRTRSEQFRSWRERQADGMKVLLRDLGDWRRGLNSAGARRLNLVVILVAMILTAGATWMWTTWRSTGLTSAEVKALTTLTREEAKSPPSPAAGPWWNQATTAPK